jgi:hypothetical protein
MSLQDEPTGTRRSAIVPILESQLRRADLTDEQRDRVRKADELLTGTGFHVDQDAVTGWTAADFRTHLEY